jgi:hypothetical protein
MSESFTHNGHEFTLEIKRDCGMRAPWIEHDGHGVVRQSTTRHRACEGGKRPGEWPLNHANRNEYQYYYDFKATIKLAARDSWGVSPEVIEAFTAKHGKLPTAKQIRAMAVEADFDYLRKYLAGDLEWYSICVTHTESGECECLGGILCDDGDDYLMDCARELAGQIYYTLEQREKTLNLHMGGL